MTNSTWHIGHKFSQDKKSKEHAKGFTLVELIIYMGMFSIIMISITGIFTSFVDSHLEAQATSSVEQDGRYILSRLTYDINRAQGSANILLPSNLGDSSSSLQLNISGVTNTFSVNGSGDLILANASGSNQLNSYDSSVSGVLFQRIGNVGGKPTLVVQFTLTSRTEHASGPEVRVYNTAIGTR